jgi:hypothetical protein
MCCPMSAEVGSLRSGVGWSTGLDVYICVGRMPYKGWCMLVGLWCPASGVQVMSLSLLCVVQPRVYLPLG